MTMTSVQIEIQLIAALVAIACAIPGTFLVLRKMSLISDAISHSILPGIVIGFFMTQDLSSPWLIIFAALTGVLTVILVEFIQKTGLVKEDTAIGLVFPALFSIGVIMISRGANDVHLDVDAVLLGELVYAPLYRWEWGALDMGPQSLWIIGIVLVVNIVLLLLFFKELKITTFDIGLSASLGLSPVLVHYGLMSIASVTIVGSFEAVGAILVVALMIVPAASAYLLTNKLETMLAYSIGFGVFSAIAGYWLAHWLDASIAGSISVMLGFVFLLVYLFAPRRGLISNIYKRKRQKMEVSLLTFLLHLHNHNEEEERHVKHLGEHINWNNKMASSVVKMALENNMIVLDGEIASLTEKGETFTNEAIDYIVDDEQLELEGMKDRYFLFRG